ncbi:hypothetical protein Tco_0948227 [Tanacetum coccineum]
MVQTSGRVRSTEEMDSAINDLTSKFARRGRNLKEFNRGPKGGDRPRVIVGRNVNHHGYGEQKSYQVKAEIPNFVGNLDNEAVLDWLYEVDKFFDIMDDPDEEQVKILAYKLHVEAGAWWQCEQDNRRAQGKRSMDTWKRMKKIIKGRFLPPDIV